MSSLFVDFHFLQHFFLIIFILIKWCQCDIIYRLWLIFRVISIYLSHYFFSFFLFLKLIILSNIVEFHIFIFILRNLCWSISSFIVVNPIGLEIQFIIVHMTLLCNLGFYFISTLSSGMLGIESGSLSQWAFGLTLLLHFFDRLVILILITYSKIFFESDAFNIDFGAIFEIFLARLFKW